MRALLTFLLVAAAAAAAPPFEDKRAGVAFSPPDRWTEVPTPPVPENADDDVAELTPVVRYQAADAASDGTLHRLDVFLLRATSASEAEKDLVDWAEDAWRDFRVQEWRDLGSGRSFSATVSGGRAFGAVLASGSRHAALFFAGGPDLTDAELIRITGTWLFIDRDDSAPLRVPPGWKARDTEHYRIRFQGDDDFAAEIGRHLEAVSAEMRRILPLEVPGSARRSLDVRVFNNKREFQAYASLNGVEGAEAYFSPAQNELVACIDERDAGHTLHVLYHEATHQYLRDVLGRKVRIPIWLDEGVSEYFFAGAFGAGGAFSIGLNEGRKNEALAMHEDGELLPLPKMFAMDRDDFYAVEGAYGQGWSVAHFLLTDPRYRGSVPRIFEALREGKSREEAVAAGLGAMTVEQLERDWKRWLLEE